MSRPVITSVRVARVPGSVVFGPTDRVSAYIGLAPRGAIYVAPGDGPAMAALMVPSPCVESFGPDGEYSRYVPFPEGETEKTTIDTTELDTTKV